MLPRPSQAARTLFLLLACLPGWLRAEIVLTAPIHDAAISTTPSLLRTFLEMPPAERRAYFDDKDKRKALRQSRDAQPYPFRWKCTAGENGQFTVVISEQEDFAPPAAALILSPVTELPPEGTATVHEVRAVNFLLGRKYYWKVLCKAPDGKIAASQPAAFTTDPFTPRLLRIPRLENVRDLGGRKGIDGKTIRQGLIYRSAGLNANSPDFNWDPKKWAKPNPAEFRVGETKLTPESIEYVTQALGWKTDLDLRSPGEVGSMSQSPAGPCVQWVHHSSQAYGSIFGNHGDCAGAGPEAMAANFRLFCDRKNYPIVFHCIAGADRTGALAYVLNGILGVSKNELENDWEITANDYFKYQNMFDNLADGFDRFGAPDDPLEKKIEAYLLKIGVTADEISAFRSIMLER